MIIEIKGIKKSYKNKAVLCGVDLTVESGKCVGVLGGNGCGKSTLLSVLAGIRKADAGEFLYDGNDLFKYPKQRSELVGYVPQGTPLFEELTARDNLLLWYKKDRLKKELESGFLKMLGIDEFIKVPVHKMSGGMKKRLSIGCSIANDPPILLLDEAMSALDISCKQKIYDYIEEHKRRGGIVILVTHDIMELELCDEIYIIKDGVATPCEYDGDLQKLISRF